MDGETKAAFSPDEFSTRNGISRATLYNLWKRGDGPRFMRIGARRRITREAEADWQRHMEQHGEQQAAA